MNHRNTLVEAYVFISISKLKRNWKENLISSKEINFNVFDSKVSENDKLIDLTLGQSSPTKYTIFQYFQFRISRFFQRQTSNWTESKNTHSDRNLILSTIC